MPQNPNLLGAQHNGLYYVRYMPTSGIGDFTRYHAVPSGPKAFSLSASLGLARIQGTGTWDGEMETSKLVASGDARDNSRLRHGATIIVSSISSYCMTHVISVRPQVLIQS